MFAGASGVFTLDVAVPARGPATSLYTLRLGDPDGRFRAVAGDIYKPLPARASGAPPPPPSDNLVFVDACAAQVTDVDRIILRYAERTLADGMELARWWEQKDKVGDYAERFDVVREYNASDRSFGFFDTALVNGAGLPVMGVVQEMFYDRQKMATGETIRAQLQEFVLRYFMRVSHFRQPDAMPAGQRASHSMFQRAVSWLPEEEERRAGFGYQQLYFKEHATGKIGKFTKDQQNAIIDLREVGPVYDWIVLKVDIFDFNLSFAPVWRDRAEVPAAAEGIDVSRARSAVRQEPRQSRARRARPVRLRLRVRALRARRPGRDRLRPGTFRGRDPDGGFQGDAGW